MVSDFRKEEYFWPGDWTADPALNPLTNFDFPRKRFREAVMPAGGAISEKSRK